MTRDLTIITHVYNAQEGVDHVKDEATAQTEQVKTPRRTPPGG